MRSFARHDPNKSTISSTVQAALIDPRKHKRGIIFQQRRMLSLANTNLQHQDVPHLDFELFEKKLIGGRCCSALQSNQQHSSITDLPAELLLMVLEHCSTEDVVSILQTCKTVHRLLLPNIDYLGEKLANRERDRIASSLRLLDFRHQEIDILTAMQYYADTLQLGRNSGYQWAHNAWLHDFCKFYTRCRTVWNHIGGDSYTLGCVEDFVKQLFWYRQLRQSETSNHSFLEITLQRYLQTLAEADRYFLTTLDSSEAFRRVKLNRLMGLPVRELTRTYQHTASSRDFAELFDRAGCMDLLGCVNAKPDATRFGAARPGPWGNVFHLCTVGDSTLALPVIRSNLLMYCSKGGHRPDRYAEYGGGSRTPLLKAAILEDIMLGPRPEITLR